MRKTEVRVKENSVTIITCDFCGKESQLGSPVKPCRICGKDVGKLAMFECQSLTDRGCMRHPRYKGLV